MYLCSYLKCKNYIMPNIWKVKKTFRVYNWGSPLSMLFIIYTSQNNQPHPVFAFNMRTQFSINLLCLHALVVAFGK